MRNPEVDLSQLLNLDYSLKHKIYQENSNGSYLKTSLVLSNTSKSDGLFVSQLPKSESLAYNVVLSALDETIIQNGCEYKLGFHKYLGMYYPNGIIFFKDLKTKPIPQITYSMGNIELQKELILCEHQKQLLIRYTVVEAYSSFRMLFHPYLVCREITHVRKANQQTNFDYETVNNGIKAKTCPEYGDLFMQFSKKVSYIPNDEWHYNAEYTDNQKIGEICCEDLFVPGYFVATLNAGDNLIFSVGFEEIKANYLDYEFDFEINNLESIRRRRLIADINKPIKQPYPNQTNRKVRDEILVPV